jgi:hypothetical protein
MLIIQTMSVSSLVRALFAAIFEAAVLYNDWIEERKCSNMYRLDNDIENEDYERKLIDECCNRAKIRWHVQEVEHAAVKAPRMLRVAILSNEVASVVADRESEKQASVEIAEIMASLTKEQTRYPILSEFMFPIAVNPNIYKECTQYCVCIECNPIKHPINEITYEYNFKRENTNGRMCKHRGRCNNGWCEFDHPTGRDNRYDPSQEKIIRGNLCSIVVDAAKGILCYNRDDVLGFENPCYIPGCPLNHSCQRCRDRPRCGCGLPHMKDRRHPNHDIPWPIQVLVQSFQDYRCRQECDDRYKIIVQKIASTARGEMTISNKDKEPPFCDECFENLCEIKDSGARIDGKRGGRLWKARMEYIWPLVVDSICDDCVRLLNAIDCPFSGVYCPAKKTCFTEHLNIANEYEEDMHEKILPETGFSGHMQNDLSDDECDNNSYKTKDSIVPSLCINNFPMICIDPKHAQDPRFDTYHMITHALAFIAIDPNMVGVVYHRILDINPSLMFTLACSMYMYFSTNEVVTRMFMSATSAWNNNLMNDVCANFNVPFIPYIPPLPMFHPVDMVQHENIDYDDDANAEL